MATIELTSPEQLQAAQQAVAATDLISNGLVQRLIATRSTTPIGPLLGRLAAVQEEIEAILHLASTDRVTQLRAEIETASEEGRIAEAELTRASIGVTAARSGQANRENAYNAAIMHLNTAKGMTAGSFFYTAADVACREAAIAEAQSEVDAALADMEAHPLAIPQAIDRERQAKAKVAALAGRVKAYRRELAQLTGADVPTVGTPDNGTGLVGSI